MKPASAKAKGRETEHAAAIFGAARTGWPLERKRMAGANDKGDLTGQPRWLAIEVKSSMAEVAVGLDQAQVETENAGAEYGLLVCRRRGRPSPEHWYAGMPYGPMLDLLLEHEQYRLTLARYQRAYPPPRDYSGVPYGGQIGTY